MDSPLGFTFGAPSLFQPPDLQKRKDTPPLHPDAELTTHKGPTVFNHSHRNSWSVKPTANLEDHVLAEGSQGSLPALFNAAPTVKVPLSSDVEAHASSSRDETAQGLHVAIDAPLDRRPLGGLFANSKISKKRNDAERKNDVESARLVELPDAPSSSGNHQQGAYSEDVFISPPEDPFREGLHTYRNKSACIDDVIPDSLGVDLGVNTDDPSQIPLIQHDTTEITLGSESRESQSLPLRSKHSSPIDEEMLARDHQTDERRVELLTQVGRRAFTKKAEKIPSIPPTQNDSTATSTPHEPNSRQCQAKSSVSPVVLQNLGKKLSRPRRLVQPIETQVKASAKPATSSDTEHDPNQNLEDLPGMENSVEHHALNPRQSIQAGESAPAPVQSPDYQDPLSRGTLNDSVIQANRTRHQHFPLTPSRPRHLDRMCRPAAAASPLRRIDHRTTPSRLGVNRSPLKSRGPPTSKKLDGQDDMYLAFGLMIKAMEREEMLEEKSQACHRLEEDLKTLRYELNGTQKALEVQANILQRARSDDSKRVLAPATRL